MSLLVMGTVALDDVATTGGVRKDMLGGSASHFLMSASLFGPAHVVGVVGEDFPVKYIRLFERRGVDCSSLQRRSGQTFHWTGEYDASNWNCAITRGTELGVLAGFEPQVTEAQRRIPYVFLANGDPLGQETLLARMRKPKFVGLDSMNLWINTMRADVTRLMKKVDLFVANDGEAALLTGETNCIRAARALRRMGPRFIVVKKGEHGVVFYSDDFVFSFPAYPVERVVDPTGAGDTFAGGLMGYLARAGRLSEAVFRKACLYATTCASFNVEGFGAARTSRMTMADVDARRAVLERFISPSG